MQFWITLCKKIWLHDYLLTLLGSVILSLDVFPIMFGGVCVSELHWLSASSDSFLSCCFNWWSCGGASFSSLMLLWSDGVEGFEDDTVGATALDISSVNMDMNWSSSNLSNSLLAAPDPGGASEPRHSSGIGTSRKVIESLTDLRWDPRLADEKSRNSSTQEGLWEETVVVGVVPLVVIFGVEGILWWENSCQFGEMFGILGGNCAITQNAKGRKWTKPNKPTKPN